MLPHLAVVCGLKIPDSGYHQEGSNRRRNVPNIQMPVFLQLCPPFRVGINNTCWPRTPRESSLVLKYVRHITGKYAAGRLFARRGICR